MHTLYYERTVVDIGKLKTVGGVHDLLPERFAASAVFLGNSVDGKADPQEVLDTIDASHLFALQQIHSDVVVEVTPENIDETLEADAMITNMKDVALMIKTADCQAVMLYDPVKQVVANIHAGWKSLVAKIIPKTLKQMEEVYDCRPENMITFAIPSLRTCCSEFSDPHAEIPAEFHQHIVGQNVDLASIADEQLFSMGIKASNINRLSGCTKCDSEQYFSYRRGDDKRMATLIWLHK